MAFDVPPDVVLPVDAVEVRLDRAPHPFELAHAAAIETHWRSEQAANPALFDGRMVLLASLAYGERRLQGLCHMVRYATFLYWRRQRGSAQAAHAFAHAALVTSDNALLAIRMGSHTVNPGAVYFAAGSFEPADFQDGVADLHGNMVREVREETGLDIDQAPRDPTYRAFSQAAGTVIFRRYRLDLDAETAVARVAGFVAGEAEPEIAGPVVIRSADDLPDGILPHMAAIVRWHFGPEGRGGA